MHQTRLPNGHMVDLGPNWIHGTDHNPILDLAKETATLTHTWEEQVNIFGEDGKPLRDGKILSDVMWGIIVQAFKHSAKHTSTIDPDESLYDFFVEKVQDAFPRGPEADREREIVMQMSELWGAFVGSPVQQQSLKFFWLEECIDGGLFSHLRPTLIAIKSVIEWGRELDLFDQFEFRNDWEY